MTKLADWVPAPTGADVLTFAGLPADDAELVRLADAQADALVTLVWSHTRGRGVREDYGQTELAQPLKAVVLSAAARAVTNPTGARRIEAGSFSTLPGDVGWSLRELAVLNSFRTRTA